MSSRNRDSFNEINITPLTDIFLVLLIIMMVISPLFDENGLSLIVPQNVEQTKEEDLKCFVVKVSNDDKYFVEDKEIPFDELKDIMITQIKVLSKEGVFIKSEENSSHGAVVKIMDLARNIGVNNVSVSEI